MLLRTVDRFYTTYHRYPGYHVEDIDADICTLKKMLSSLLNDLGLSNVSISDDHIHEM